MVMAENTLKYDELLEKAYTTLNSYVEADWPVVKQTVRIHNLNYNVYQYIYRIELP